MAVFNAGPRGREKNAPNPASDFPGHDMPDQPVTSNGTKYPSPKKIRRLILTATLLTVTCLAALIATGVYVYRHPKSVGPLIAKSIATFTGLEVSAEELSYGLVPLFLHARRIRVVPAGKSEDDFKLVVGSLDVLARINGPFGRRTLTVEPLRIEGFEGSLPTLNRAPDLLAALIEPGPPSLAGRLAKRLVRYLLFSDIKWAGLEADDGRVSITSESWQLRSEGIEVTISSQLEIDVRGRSLEGHAGPQVRLATSGYHLHVDPEDPAAAGATAGRLLISDSLLHTPPMVWQDVSIDAQLVYYRDRSEISLSAVKLDGRAVPRHVSAEARQPGYEVSLAARGNMRLAETSLELSEWSLNATDLLAASGHARLDLAPPYHLELNLTECGLKSHALGGFYRAVTGRPRLPLSLSGDIGVAGHAAGPLSDEFSLWQGDVMLTLKRVPLVFEDAGTRLATDLTGSVAATGQLLDPQLKIDLDADDLVITGSGAALTGFQPSLSAAGRFPVLDFALRTRGAGALLTKGGLRIEQAKVKLDRGRIDLQSMDVSLPRMTLSTATLNDLTASLTGNPNQALMQVRARNSGLVRTAASLRFLPAGWRINAQETLDLTLDWQAGAGVSLNSRMELTDLRFSSPEESRIGEAVQINIDTTAHLRLEGGIVRSEMNLSAGGGEILWGRYYLDLSATPLAAAGKIEWDPARRRLTLDRLVTSLKDLVALSASGTMRSTAGVTSVDLRVKVAETSATTLYRNLVAEPYKYDRPFLSDTLIDGRIGAELALFGNTDALNARGRAYWKEGRIGKKNGSLVLSGIDLDLPLWYQAVPEKIPGSPLRGHLAVADMQLPRLDNQPLRLEFDVGPNRLTIPRPSVLNAFSGRVDVGPVTVSHLYSDRTVMETDIALSGIAIDRLLEGIWQQPTGGVLAGRLESVRLEDSRLSTKGILTADIFGGSIDIIDPGVSELRSSVPVLKLSSRINDLDLEQMTSGTTFGKIRGILQGTVNGIEIVDGQPQRFDLRLETVDKKGVPQRINIQAVDNIARLGGGASPFMGMAGSFAKIFREFPYRKIGIAAKLDNDIFRVNGTIKENGTEYLVKKGGFSGVNVVNLNPDNRVSFKDMIKRIKRISGSQAGPEIR